MNTKQHSGQPRKINLPGILSVLFLFPALVIFALYGLSFLPSRHTSSIPAREFRIAAQGQECTLAVPAGQLSFTHPSHAAVGATYGIQARVTLDGDLRLKDCTGEYPNWNLSLEARTTPIAANIEPDVTQRQPTVGRRDYRFDWKITPTDPMESYASRLWLRAVFTEKGEEIERWDLLVREFNMEYIALLGKPTVLWLYGAGFSAVVGLLFALLAFQRRRKSAGNRI